MLTELRIRDFAVIDRLALTLGPGLSVLTGETGAGKSIIVDALSLVLGARASADVVRTGADRAVIEATFDVSRDPDVATLLDATGIALEDGLLIIRREVAAEGRSRVWLNGSAATVTTLAEVGALLVDLHGQHEHQSLLRSSLQRDMLDEYAGARAAAAEVEAAYGRSAAIRARMQDLESRAREIQQRIDFLRFQLEEIDRAQLKPGEAEELEAEAVRLEHAGELASLAEDLHQQLYAGDDAMAGRLADIRRTLDQLVRIDDRLAVWRETVENALLGLQELGREMGSYAAAVESDPARLDALRRRQDTIDRLLRKYGPEIADVLATADQARAEISAHDTAGWDREKLERDLAAAQEELKSAAAKLTKARRTAASKLGKGIVATLGRLGMEQARFEVALEPLPEAGRHGAESVEFRIAVNTGFEPRPLARVASGGELSRVMLALKTEFARLDAVPTLVFDEIDAGIGGRIGARLAEQLAQVAEHHQVFVISHLPQIAARAQRHFFVEKSAAGGITATRVHDLAGDDRVRELARLLGGDPESSVSLEHARELLNAS